MTTCLVCPDARPREAEAGKRACFHCSNRILRHLADLETYVPTLSLLKTTSGQEGRRKPGFGSSSPANDTAIHHTDWRTTPTALDGMGAVATVHEWATNVREGRDLSPPQSFTFWGEVDALRANHAWIVCQEWVGDYATELREIHAAVRATAGDPVPKPVAKCIHQMRHGECRGDVYELPDASGVKCSTCGRIYTGLDYDRLRVAQEAS